MIGEGIKQIPSYKCTLPYDKLQELRNEFWSTRKNSRVWLVLKTCCETDACNIYLFIYYSNFSVC